MVDTLNPTSQFHPYQPPDVMPQSGTEKATGFGSLLSKLGIDQRKLDAMTSKMDVRGGLDRARNVARNNSGLVLGGLAALAIGAGLLRRRSTR